MNEINTLGHQLDRKLKGFQQTFQEFEHKRLLVDNLLNHNDTLIGSHLRTQLNAQGDSLSLSLSLSLDVIMNKLESVFWARVLPDNWHLS